ncbi:MAG TPA: glycerol-3-phosphate 1-O-acyltransferase PlsY [Dehalococcoidia bacterium]|nr:glycerol-3-phosphate 1-O-acyltransferase PlsY [Dehalococcoidia bacterium]
MTEYVAVIIGSYLIGSIPWGLIAGKLRGVDVRKYGSGSIGTTNVLRTIGTKSAVVVLGLDVLKGVTAILIGHYVIGSPMGEMAAGFAAIAGHDWSLFLKFKGGRGVATSLGALLPMAMPAPLSGVIGLAVFVLVALASRYVSLASIVGSLAAVAAMGAFWAVDRAPWQYFVFIGVAVALIIFQHRDNITRLLSGKESKLGQKGEKRQI